ncbi:MAG: hypothetical protein EBR82_34860 [Caulobacteraceae bacterium]|nr:hypothetical protein [Caulobacteraceae bacterium]
MKIQKPDLAWAYIELLLTENSRLHKTIGLVDRFFGDVMANCSREVYEANMANLTEDLEGLAQFLAIHQERIKALSTHLKGQE